MRRRVDVGRSMEDRAPSWLGHLAHRVRASMANLSRSPWRPRSLVERYSIASATWHDAIHRLGYLDAYAEVMQHAAAAMESKGERTRSSRGAVAVLDAGCGTGAFSLVFARWHRSSARKAPHGAPRLRIDLLDPSPRMLTAALDKHQAEHSDAHTLCGSIDTLPCHAERYDVVLCSHVLEHADNAEDALALLGSVLVPGGVLMLVVSQPHWCTRILQVKWGSASWRVDEVFHMLRNAQFTELAHVPFSKGPPSRTSVGYIARKASVG